MDSKTQEKKNPPKKKLNAAKYKQDFAKIKEAIEAGADIDAHRDGRTALIASCDSGGSSEITKYLIEKGADVNFGLKDKENALTYATMYNKLDLVKLLLHHGADVNKKGGYGRTPIHFALIPVKKHNDYIEIIKTLLEAGADVNAYNDGGDTPLLEALWNEFFTEEALNLLLQYNVDLTLANTYYDDTPLRRASEKGKLELVRILNKATSNIKVDANELETTLIKTYREDQKEIVLFLLEENKDIEDNSFYCGPILSIAAQKGHLDVMQWLIDHGLDIKDNIEAANYAVMEAAYTNKLDSIKFLVERGADVNGGEYGAMDNALMKTARHNYIKMAEYLLEMGANIEAPDYRGNTPLFFAAWEGKLEMVKFLLEKGANIEAKNNLNWTALMQAAVEGHEKVVKFLLDKGASIKEVDKEKGASVLILAAWAGSRACVQHLLEHGAEKNIKDNEGKTAEDIALEKWGSNFADYIKKIKNYK